MPDFILLPTEGATGSSIVVREIEVLDFELLSPPESPSAGDTYTVGRNATGPWYLWDDDIATYVGSGIWSRTHATIGMCARKAGTSEWRIHDGSGWRVSERLGDSASNIIASVTQSSGQVPLGHAVNRVTTVAHAGDAVTLPAARAGRTCWIANDGALALGVYPQGEDGIDGSASALSVAAGGRVMFFAAEDGEWCALVGA